jgi:hypothetical protein
MLSGPVNEGSSCTLSCTFYDENGNAVTPTEATYRLDDIKATGDTNITPETAFTPGDLEISADENRILDASKQNERRMVTIRWTYAGGAKKGASQEEYLLKNLSKVS